MAKRKPIVRWNTDRLAADMALRGWNVLILSKQAGVTYKTVNRFLTGEVQTAKIAGRLADALGYHSKRYFAGIEVSAP